MRKLHAGMEKVHVQNDAKCLRDTTTLLKGGRGVCIVEWFLIQEYCIYCNVW